MPHNSVYLQVAILLLIYRNTYAMLTFDSQNFMQSIKTYGEQIKQLNELKQQTEHHILQSKQLLDQSKMQRDNLQKLKFNNLGKMYDNLNNISGLLTRSRASLDKMKEIDNRYRSVFGLSKADPLPTEEQNAMMRYHLQHNIETNRRAMSALKVLDSYENDKKVTRDLVNQSQQATGQMQALQSSNQLSAMQIKELQEMKVLMAEQLELRSAAIAEENTSRVIVHQQLEYERARPLSLTKKIELPKLR